jgi:hypothetical protein
MWSMAGVIPRRAPGYPARVLSGHAADRQLDSRLRAPLREGGGNDRLGIELPSAATSAGSGFSTDGSSALEERGGGLTLPGDCC